MNNRNNKEIYQKHFFYQGQKITVEKNLFARQSDNAFLVRWNNSVVLVTLCVGKSPMAVNFVPLTIEFQENLFSVGKIPGGFNRREGRISQYSSLSARIVDRAIRSFFPKDFCYETQIFINPMAVDHSLDLRVVAVLATSLVLNTSDLPFDSILAGVTVGFIDNAFIINPSYEVMKKSKLEMFLTGTETKINMIEVSSAELTEEQILQAIKFGHENIIEVIKIQKQILADFTITKKTYPQVTRDNNFKNIREKINLNFAKKIEKLLNEDDGEIRKKENIILEKEIIEHFKPLFLNEETSKWTSLLLNEYNQIIREKFRKNIILQKKRIDQRAYDEIRLVSCKNDILPVVHGSAYFQRGETQTLSVVTLATKKKNKIVDDLTIDTTNSFFHHYRSLPFSLGITQRAGSISRREIGHGALGEKALRRVLPSFENFPYAIRVASEVLASNGSTSQAAICSASLALFSAGVPIKNAVAGIAVGLIKENDRYLLLSDIQAWEDFYGDMDFKIAGTKNGICSIQLDLKIDGLPLEIIEKILVKGKTDRDKVLVEMNKIIDKPRPEVATSALKYAKLEIDSKEIGLVIGPNGKNIKQITSNFPSLEIEIDEKGIIYLFHNQKNKLQEVINSIKTLIKPEEAFKIGMILDGKIDGITKYGAFVKLSDKKNGLIHISTLSNGYVTDVKKFLKLGQLVKVKILNINEKNQIELKLA